MRLCSVGQPAQRQCTRPTWAAGTAPVLRVPQCSPASELSGPRCLPTDPRGLTGQSTTHGTSRRVGPALPSYGLPDNLATYATTNSLTSAAWFEKTAEVGIPSGGCTTEYV